MGNKKKLMIIGIIAMLAIGFASVSTILYVNGTLGINTNDSDFDVHFIAASLDDESAKDTTNASVSISEDKKSITFSTKELKSVGDNTVLSFTILNNSSQYDAEAYLDCYGVTSATDSTKKDFDSDVLSLTSSLGFGSSNKFSITAKKTKDGNLTAKLSKVVMDPTTIYIKCDIAANAVERTSAGEINASEISISGLTDTDGNVIKDADGNEIKTVEDALNYLYANK